jgi:colanic acid biosynthesis glycosyl transferase WcaI
VVRTWLLPFPNRKAYERILNYASFAVSAALRGLFIDRPDIVIATSPQLLVGLSGWWLARWMRVPFIFEVRDLWPESLSAVGMKDSSLLHRVLSGIAGFLYKTCDRVVVVTDAFRDHLVLHWKVPDEKISVVENGVETALFAPGQPDGALRKSWNAEDKFVACYIGTMGWAHGLDTLLQSAASLHSSSLDVLFVLVGEGADKDRICSAARDQGLTNLRFVGQQPRETIPDFIRASDVCLVLLKKTELFKTVIPTKMLEFMSCAKPVILGVDGQARSILEAGQAGVYIEPEDASQLVDAIERLRNNPEACKNFGASGRVHIMNHFSRQKTAETYLQVLERVLNR